MTPATIPIGDRTTNPITNLNIADDFPAISAYNSYMLEEENSRVKGLLVATTLLYFVGWIVGIISNRVVNSDNYIVWTFE